MKCPKCEHPETRIRHSYTVGSEGTVQSRVCPKCHCVITTQIVVKVINIDPPYGQGAASVVKRIKEKAA